METSILRFINVYTHGIIREEPMNYEQAIRFIQDLKNQQLKIITKHPDNLSIIMDKQMRFYDATYITDKTHYEDAVKVYSVYFQVKLHEKQFHSNR